MNATQFKQALNNLITNALKFSKSDIVPRITVSSELGEGAKLQQENPALTGERILPGQVYRHIRIMDNGIGFDTKYREQIFKVFQRLYGQDEYPGTGIGLAIVKRIMTGHAGFIVADGIIDKGASFDIYIPHAN